MVKIIFKNQPTLSINEADKNFNERRLSLIPFIENFLSNLPLLSNKDVSVTFLNSKGVSSLVSIVETFDQKLVLKIPLSKAYSLGEAQFLKTWESVGVKVPHIVSDGFLNDHAYILYEYIEGKTLGESYTTQELIDNNKYHELGVTLRRMHEPKTTGYGSVRNGAAEYKTFREWLESPEVKKKVGYVQEHNLLNEKHGSLVKAFEILINFVESSKESSYCHEDLHPYNIFDTNPITIFDPNPRFHHGYIDVARCLYGSIFDNEPIEARQQLIEGYFKDETYNKQALHAAILLYGYMKFTYAHKTNKIEGITNVQRYLIENKKLLD